MRKFKEVYEEEKKRYEEKFSVIREKGVYRRRKYYRKKSRIEIVEI